MTHRERFRKVAGREGADRAVFDICGSPQTLIDYEETKNALLSYLGYTGTSGGNFLDERILTYFDIDTRLVGAQPIPATVLKRQEGNVYYDSYGIGYRAINGHYEICRNPLADCTIDEMMAYPLPEVEDFDQALLKQWKEEAQYLHENSSYAVVAAHPILGVFEIGCWLFGFDDYLYRIAGEPELVHAFSKRILDYQKKIIQIYYSALGPYIDCTTSGDDFGMQTGTFMSVEMFDEMIKPYLKERVAYTKKFTGAFYQHHTCGSVYSLIPCLIDCGIDILNPIQPGTYMMEPERLKKDYGNRISFWGGVDTQELLPRGSREDVKEKVKQILSIMGTGGYILSPAHCIQYDVPAENIAAIFEGALEYGAASKNFQTR
jgi:uroporphyrinogen decarboxylase